MYIPEAISQKIDTLMRPFREKQAQNESAFIDDTCRAIIAIAESKPSAASQLPPGVAEHYAYLLDSARRDGVDIEATIANYLQRKKWAALLQDLESRKKAAELAERTMTEAVRAENLRHEAELKRIDALAEKQRTAQMSWDESVAAKSDLIAGAELPAEYRELSNQLVKLAEKERELERKLNPNGSQESGPPYYPTLANEPAALQRATQEALADKNSSAYYDPARVAQLKERVVACKRAVAEVEAELKDLQKQRAAINRRLATFEADRLRPEKFPLKKKSLAFDEQSKRLANQLGWGVPAQV